MARNNAALVDELGMRVWVELGFENAESWNKARLCAVLRRRVEGFRRWPYGEKPLPYRGDALRLVERLRHREGLGVSAVSFEGFQYRK